MKTNYLIAFLIIVSCSAVFYAQNSTLRIVNQPKSALPADYGTLCAQGTVRLKVEFLANGQIGNIIPITRMPVSNLTELAVEAAKQIKFEPEIRGSQAISVLKTIEYAYGWDLGGWKGSARSADGSRGTPSDLQAEAVLQKAIQNLGGDKYLQVKTQIGRGKFSVMRDGVVVSFQSFIDVIVFPDKERTEFKGGGVKSVQTNVGNAGWTFDGDAEMIKVQDEKQVANFKRGIRVSLDHLLRGSWRNDATLSYVGKRAATLGKRNDIVKLTYKDGLAVEFEFSDEGVPQKATYTRLNGDNVEIKEEDRYAQFIDVGGVRSPFIIDRFSNGVQNSRINYETIEFNKSVTDSIFTKPSSPRELKKDLKF